MIAGMRVTDGGHKAEWHVPEDLPELKGHFPGAPIVPAIVLIDITVDLIRRLSPQKSLELQEVPRAKFAGPVLPGMTVSVSLRPVDAGGEWEAEWISCDTNRPLTTLRVRLA